MSKLSLEGQGGVPGRKMGSQHNPSSRSNSNGQAVRTLWPWWWQSGRGAEREGLHVVPKSALIHQFLVHSITFLLFVHSFNCSFVSIIHPSIHSFTCSFILSFTSSFIGLTLLSFVGSSFISLFLQLCVPLFFHPSFIDSFIHSVIPSFLHACMHACAQPFPPWSRVS